MKLSKSNIIILALVAIVVFMLIRGCNKSNTESELQDKLNLKTAFADSLLQEVVNGKKVYSKAVLAASDEAVKEFLKENDHELYKLSKNNTKVGIITKTATKIDTVVKNVIDTVKDTRTANVTTPHYTADIVSTPLNTSLKLNVFDTVQYSVGKDYRLRSTHSNPYLNVTELNSFYIKPDNKPKNFKYWLGAIAGGIFVYGLTR